MITAYRSVVTEVLTVTLSWLIIALKSVVTAALK